MTWGFSFSESGVLQWHMPQIINNKEMLDFLREIVKIFFKDWNRKVTLLLIWLPILSIVINIRLRKRDRLRRQKEWEEQERKKAQIRKEEMKDLNK